MTGSQLGATDRRRRSSERFGGRALAFLAAFLVAWSATAVPGQQSATRYTPVPRTAAPSGSVVPAPPGCQAADVRARVEQFFAAFNRGDAAGLNDALSRAFLWYSIGPPEEVRNLTDRQAAIRFFLERAAAGERLTLASIDVNLDLADGQVGFSLAINRALPGLQLRHKGKGAVYCGPADTPGILVFSFAPADP